MTLDDLIFLRRELPTREQASIDNIAHYVAIGSVALPERPIAAVRRYFGQLDEVFELAEAELRRREDAQ